MEEIAARSSVPTTHLRMSGNLGPAGGFHAGLRCFLDRDGATAWLMDDDVAPDPDCLERMLAGHQRVTYPLIVDRQGREYEKYGWMGLLVSREVVQEVGLPIADLFWGSEDGEWVLHRMRDRAGYGIDRVREAIVRVDLRDEVDKPPWKFYYESRNSVYLLLHRYRTPQLSTRLKILMCRLGRLLALAGGGTRRLASAGAIARGIGDGLTRRLGARVQPSSSDRPR